MDIDDFLDRELAELGLDSGKPKDLGLIESEETEPSSLFESIRINLEKGNLEEAEQAYVQLWHLLIEEKLKWNKDIYDQLLILSRQFLNSLNKAYNDIKKKADYIYSLIKKARVSLKEGKKDAPYKIYAEIQEINNSIPNVFFEEKKIIHEQIAIFYEELKNTTDNELMKRVNGLVQEINQLIDKMNIFVRSNDFTNATLSYYKCIELYNQVPEGFLKNKTALGIRILELYKSISIHEEISYLQREMLQQASQIKRQAQPLIQPLPATFLKSNISGRENILRQKTEHAKRNIEKGFINEASKDIEEALQIAPKDAEAKVYHAKIKTLK